MLIIFLVYMDIKKKIVVFNSFFIYSILFFFYLYELLTIVSSFLF